MSAVGNALRAAVRPERTEDLFFVADGTGGHVFAKTLGDQTRNIALRRRGTSADADPASAPNTAPAVTTPTSEPPRPAKPAPAAATRPVNSAPAVILRATKPRQPADKDRRSHQTADQPSSR